jgi:hypothetical protein
MIPAPRVISKISRSRPIVRHNGTGAMDKTTILRLLDEAQNHIAQGERAIRRQREVVAELRRDGHNTARARALLAEFEQIQRVNVSERELLIRQLERLSPKPGAA